MAKKAARDFTEVKPRSRAEWRQWLSENHELLDKAWLLIAKKESGLPSLTVSDVVEEALCFGWIDSVANKVDENYFKLLMARRNPKSKWSKINKARVSKLIKEKLMTPSGLAAVTQAKKSGTWTALDEVEMLVVPKALAIAFRANKQAKKNFESFPRSVKRGILEWITNAKTEATLAKRVNETVVLAAQNIRANQWPRTKPTT